MILFLRKCILLFRLLLPLRIRRWHRKVMLLFLELPEWQYRFAMEELNDIWTETAIRLGVDFADSFSQLPKD